MKIPSALKMVSLLSECVPFPLQVKSGGNAKIERSECFHSAEDLLTVMNDFAWNWTLFQATVSGQLKPVFIPIS